MPSLPQCPWCSHMHRRTLFTADYVWGPVCVRSLCNACTRWDLWMSHFSGCSSCVEHSCAFSLVIFFPTLHAGNMLKYFLAFISTEFKVEVKINVLLIYWCVTFCLHRKFTSFYLLLLLLFFLSIMVGPSQKAVLQARKGGLRRKLAVCVAFPLPEKRAEQMLSV